MAGIRAPPETSAGVRAVDGRTDGRRQADGLIPSNPVKDLRVEPAPSRRRNDRPDALD